MARSIAAAATQLLIARSFLLAALVVAALGLAASARSQALPDAGSAPPAHEPFVLPYQPTDVVFDGARGRLYATAQAEKRVYFVDLASGLTTHQFDFEYEPEHLAITPDGNRLFVGLLHRPHSAYWWDGEHSGDIASFDLDLQVQDRQFEINEDPYALVATANGQIVVSSGSGQHTYVRSYDAVTGVELSATSRVYHRTRLTPHPSGAIIYGADQGLSPSDIERIDIDASGQLTYRWDSRYHGDHRMWGNVWASPLGDVLVTRGSGVFSAAGATRNTDMIHQRDLDVDRIDRLVWDEDRNVFLTMMQSDSVISYFNLESLEWIVDQTVSDPIEHVGIVGPLVYTLSFDTLFDDSVIPHVSQKVTLLSSHDHAVPDGDTNSRPVAAFDVSPPSGITTLSEAILDATPSTDAESDLVYRWDLDDDGVWDTEFSDEAVLTHRFITAGTQFVRLQVKDHAGLVDSILRQIDVTFEADPGAPGETHPSFALPFEATHAIFDPHRPWVYVSSAERSAVYFVNLETGFIEKSFSLPFEPGQLGMTPDGSRLYVGLLVHPHSSYRWEDDQEGYIASFDLERQVKDRQFWVPVDPYSLAPRDNGHLVVSSGSGQWTRVYVVNGATGAVLSFSSRPYHRTRFVFHPNQTMLYAADTSLSPSDIERYDVSAAGQIAYRWDSRYHGDHRMYGNVWPSPLGDILITRGADVFSAAGADRTTDMSYLSSLPTTRAEGVAFDPVRNSIITGRDGAVEAFNLSSLERISSVSVTGDVSYVGVHGLDVHAMQVEGGASRILRLDHPAPDGDTDTPPSAAWTVTPSTGFTTLTDITFDASSSSDAEGGLVYRWDIDGDGEWDGPFTSDPVTVYRFPTSGTKQVRLQVKDAVGWVSNASFTLDVAFEPDPGSPGDAHPGFELQFEVADAVFDARRPYLYVSDPEGRRVHIVNTETGFIEKTFAFDDLIPENMTITPDGSRLFVALLTRPHSAYWWDDDHEGYIASFDLDAQVKDRQFWINEDPWGLAATDDGVLVVTSGSGQWTYVRTYDAATGTELGSARGVRHGTNIALHPGGTIVYGADRGLSPSDIERYDIAPDGSITYRWDSIYHGAHRMGGDVWPAPSGDFLITRGGDAFTAAGADRSSDMTFLRRVTPSYIDALFYDPVRNVIFTGRDEDVAFYNLHSLEEIGATKVEGDLRFLGGRGLEIKALVEVGGFSRIVPVEHPAPSGDTDAWPEAALVIQPRTGVTTNTEVVLDASGSTDAEGDVVYRWDLDADGEWDGPFAPEPIAVQRYGTAGTRFVRVQVKDAMGNVDEADARIDVAFEPDPGAPGEPHPGFHLPFEATDALFDPERPFVYVTSAERKALYVVSLESGLIERTFEFDEMPERMTITPDGKHLFVALLPRAHSSTWWEEDQGGYIARFDLDLQVKDQQFWIPLDPYGLAARDDGALVVTSGSGQWTYIASFDGETGEPRGEPWPRIRERSLLDLHPSGGMVYTAGGTSYPQDVRRYDFGADGGVDYSWDSIYHGQHRVGNDLWISPLGDQLVTSRGDAFSANGTSRTTDILYLATVKSTIFHDILWTPSRGELAAIEASSVSIFDMSSYDRIAEYPLAGDGRFLGRRGPLLYAMQVEDEESRIEIIVHDNHAPVADATAAAVSECTGPGGAAVRFDASWSADEDSVYGVIDDIVSYRWFDAEPGTADAALLGEGPVVDLELPVGHHEIWVEVTDHGGLSGVASTWTEVVDSTPPTLTVTASPDRLWPPNSRMRDVTFDVVAEDACGDVTVVLTGAESNEVPSFWQTIFDRFWWRPDISGAEIGTDDRQMQLRAERNWNLSKRIYTVSYAATDSSGNEATASTDVTVQRRWGAWFRRLLRRSAGSFLDLLMGR